MCESMAAPVFTFVGDLLHQAAIFDQKDLLRSLLKAGVHGDANSPDARGLTPLHTAALHNSAECLAELLQWKGTFEGIHHDIDQGIYQCLVKIS